MKRKTQANKLFDLFKNCYVQVVLRKNFRSYVTDANDQIVDTTDTPGVMEGYLNDEDDKYYFLGTNQESIQFAIKKIQVVQIGLIDMNEEIQKAKAEILNKSISKPINDNGIN